MEFLVFWVGTSVASFCLEVANELRMFKDVADNGYKIDTKRLSELGEQLNPNGSKIHFLSMLIPIYNMMLVLQRALQYNNCRGLVLDQLRVMDTLEEMSEIEKEEYAKKPTGLNALLVPFKLEIRLANAEHITINENNENSEIFFEIGESLNDITILKVNGDASSLTVQEQKQKVIETLKTIFKAGLEKYGDEESLINALHNNDTIDVSDNEENKKDEETVSQTTQELSISEQKQSLKNLKNELLEEKERVQPIQTDKGRAITKKKK